MTSRPMTNRPMTNRRRVVTAVLTGALAMAGLAACGDDGGGDSGFTDMSVEKIKDAVLDDMNALDSLKMSGSITSGGEEMSIELSATSDGECVGTVGLKGGSAQFISGPGGTFLKGDDSFWQTIAGSQASQITDMLGEKWAKVPDTAAGEFDQFCDLDEFLKSLNEDDSDKIAAEKGDVTEVAGQDALEITDTDEDTNGTTHAFIAVDDPHYILKITQTGGDEPGAFEFSDFNEPVDAEAPSSDDYVDLSQVG